MEPCRTCSFFLASFVRCTPSMLADCCVHTRLFLTAERAAVRALSSCWWAHGCLQFGALSVKVPRMFVHQPVWTCAFRSLRQSPAVECLGQWEVRVNILRNTWSGDLTPGSPCPSTRCRHWMWWVFLTSANGGKRMTSRGQCASCAVF